MEYVVEMLNIRKEFPGIVANDNIKLQLKKGEVHALLGENGAGKSTLMGMLFGMYKPDRGCIKVRGKEVKISNPNVANDLGIGMVHQHFKLVENFTVTENITLGCEPKKGLVVDIKTAAKRIEELSKQYGLNVDPYAKIEDISVGMQQRVEILKMLYRNANVLIFDEPTAVLTPSEIDELISIIKEMTKEGKSVIIITHKLKEIKAVADKCTVIRRGKYIGTVDVKDTTESEMAKMMVGREVSFKVEKSEAKPKETVVSIKNISVKNNKKVLGLKNFSLDIKAGEITLAHNGILFLDEILEFKKEILELLRQPLEDRIINVSRLKESYTLPSNFILVGTFNPCPCGKMLDYDSTSVCTCSEIEKKRYINRMSRALLDRIDILNFVPRIKSTEIDGEKDKINSDNRRHRVILAREIQKERFKGSNYRYNSEVVGKDVLKMCNLSKEGKKVLESYYKRYDITLRGYTKIVKVARTIADLECRDEIMDYHIIEAIGFRKNVFGEII